MKRRKKKPARVWRSRPAPWRRKPGYISEIVHAIQAQVEDYLGWKRGRYDIHTSVVVELYLSKDDQDAVIALLKACAPDLVRARYVSNPAGFGNRVEVHFRGIAPKKTRVRMPQIYKRPVKKGKR